MQQTPGSAAAAPGLLVRDPGRLRSLADDIATGAVTSVALVHRYLTRTEQVEARVHGWRELDGDRALAIAQERDAEVRAGNIRGALHGVPVAIKDIIDVEGLPTRANSRSRAQAKPAVGDAEIVRALKGQGAVVLGKAHTTEFAFFDPSAACNPHNPEHTPGGSSSGSAAVVAAGMAPMAIGTQTVASVNRPAAYCGIAAFKPSTGCLATFGITPLGPSYDTPGFYGWSVDDAAYAFEAVAPRFLPAAAAVSARPLCVVRLADPHLDDAEREIVAAIDAAAKRIETSGHAVTTVASPIPFARLFRIQRSTMLYEAGRALRYLLDAPSGTVGAKLTEAIHEGLAIAPAQYLAERAEIDAMRHRLFAAVPASDLFLWPATPATAPKGLAWTGDPKYIAPWTALGGPIVTMPIGRSSAGLPIGCILAGRPGEDHIMTHRCRLIADVAERHH